LELEILMSVGIIILNLDYVLALARSVHTKIS